MKKANWCHGLLEFFGVLGNLHLTSNSKLLSAEPSVTKGMPVLPPSLIPNLMVTSSTSASLKI
jgi:hypothetical protein